MAPPADESEAEQPPGLMERVQQFVEDDRRKWGGMTPGAMGRLGLAELRDAVSLGGNVDPATPYGMYGTLTPGEVAAGRQDTPQEESVLGPAYEYSPDMAAGVHESAGAQASPGDIADDKSIYGAEQGHSANQAGAPPSPGDIADDNTISEPDQGLDRGQDNSRGR